MGDRSIVPPGADGAGSDPTAVRHFAVRRVHTGRGRHALTTVDDSPVEVTTSPGPRRSPTRRWLFVVLGLQVVWDVVLALQSQFFNDDFLFFRLARSEGLTVDLLKRSAFGHFVPA